MSELQEYVALAMVNAMREKHKDLPIQSIEELAKEARPLWRLKATAAIEAIRRYPGDSL